MPRTAIAVLLILALSGAGALAQTIDSPAVNVRPTGKTSPVSHVHPAMNHRCCGTAFGPAIEIASPPIPENMPCGGQHSCCLRPAPANSPDLPTTHGPQRPEVNRAASVPEAAKGSSSAVPTNSKHIGDFLSYAVLSTILRI